MKTKQELIEYEVFKQEVVEACDKGLITPKERDQALEYLIAAFHDRPVALSNEEVDIIIEKIYKKEKIL